MKRAWGPRNPLYRWMHKEKRKVNKASRRKGKQKKVKRMGRRGMSVQSAAKGGLMLLGAVFLAKTAWDATQGGSAVAGAVGSAVEGVFQG